MVSAIFRSLFTSFEHHLDTGYLLMPPYDQLLDSFDFHAFSVHLNIVIVFDTFFFESDVERTLALGHFVPGIDYVLACQNYLIRVSQKLDLSVIESLLIEADLLL